MGKVPWTARFRARPGGHGGPPSLDQKCPSMAAEKRVQGLDGVRAAAAAYVVAAHVLLARVAFFGQGQGGWLLAAGQEAVIVFFLLSGAVIRISVEARGGVDGDFLARRFIRLFPVLLLGLVLGYLSEAATMRGWPAADWGRLAGNLAFLQDFEPVKPGVICSTYYSNSPLWSLSYEWWFYVLFFVVWRRVAAPWRTHVAGLISVVAWVRKAKRCAVVVTRSGMRHRG